MILPPRTRASTIEPNQNGSDYNPPGTWCQPSRTYAQFILTSEAVRVVAIVVTYHPDLTRLQLQLEELASQVAAIVIVDNASDSDLAVWAASRTGNPPHVIALERNHGIAHAQNVGVQWARSQAATHILLMDQDSVPSTDMVDALLDAALNNPVVAAVGPRYLDSRQDAPSPFVRIRGLRFQRMAWDPGHPVVRVDCLIASGCLIPMSVIDQVGPMREDLFIDYVDTEWCLRARNMGLQSYGVCTASMSHSLGETPYFFLGRSFPVHSPLRHYYQVRNAITLIREHWVPTDWKLALGWHLLLKVGFYSLVMAPRLQHLRMMVTGLWHGMRGRAGPLTP